MWLRPQMQEPKLEMIAVTKKLRRLQLQEVQFYYGTVLTFIETVVSLRLKRSSAASSSSVEIEKGIIPYKILKLGSTISNFHQTNKSRPSPICCYSNISNRKRIKSLIGARKGADPLLISQLISLLPRDFHCAFYTKICCSR